MMQTEPSKAWAHNGGSIVLAASIPVLLDQKLIEVPGFSSVAKIIPGL